MRGEGRDGMLGVLAVVGLAMSACAWGTRGALAWGLRLGGLVLVALSALALLVAVIRQREP